MFQGCCCHTGGAFDQNGIWTSNRSLNWSLEISVKILWLTIWNDIWICIILYWLLFNTQNNGGGSDQNVWMKQYYHWIECAQYHLLHFAQSGIKAHYNSDIEPYFFWANVNQCSTGNVCVFEGGNVMHWYMHKKYNMTESLSFCHQYISSHVKLLVSQGLWERGLSRKLVLLKCLSYS